MSSMLETVSKSILEPSELQLDQLDGFLGSLQGRYIDAGDLYFQTSQQESWVMDDGILREGSFSIEKGVGIRAMSEEKTGFAYCDDLRSNAITRAVSNARAIVRQAKLGGLLCTAHPLSDGGCALDISGPLALFRSSRAYARALSSIVPLLPWCRRYQLRADCTARS